MSYLTDFLRGITGPTGPTGSGSGGQHHEFYAATGQTLFNTTPYFNVDGNYKVIVEGSFRGWGHTLNGNTVAFTSGEPGFNEEVSIWQ